jgi:hypothetical protein
VRTSLCNLVTTSSIRFLLLFLFLLLLIIASQNPLLVGFWYHA